MGQSVFRKVALERLSSPEQLDRLIQVTSPRAWLALVASVALLVGTVIWGVAGRIPVKAHANGVLMHAGGIREVLSSESGQVSAVEVHQGTIVEAGQTIAQVEVRHHDGSHDEREDHTLKVSCTQPGQVLELLVEKGSWVQEGEPIALIGSVAEELEAVIYVPPSERNQIHPGMEVQLSPSTVNREEYGCLLGEVKSVAQFPATRQGLMQVLKNEQLVKRFMAEGAPLAVTVEPIVDTSTPSGYRWSTAQGYKGSLPSGTACEADIIVEYRRPISWILPVFED